VRYDNGYLRFIAIEVGINIFIPVYRGNNRKVTRLGELINQFPAEAAFVHVIDYSGNSVYIKGYGISINKKEDQRQKKSHGKAHRITPYLYEFLSCDGLYSREFHFMKPL
jgi:hypothetical protein